eukprot:Plantae.Rhodophyta-Purpureofilum_apyrenoidigerum.ctg8523.p1 GENE.Plantae.Rhodophyta-Purpureofilum_apyrenoidigerum.ctg8523~~Plantae.Rhodophyta-Purpureofilum_apyrenoidigerum.ctg8523.p1  ORF type:complete len:471 (+),score=72.34 Plantae.Rhodophyta-Purpureofilum_apyrenoidigerum.ctg8523:35-1414(+)
MGDGTVKLTDLNDFLRPSDVCILPAGGGMRPAPKPGSFSVPIYGLNSEKGDAAKVAKVTLSDCISCSGCITSAETVLTSSETALSTFQSGIVNEENFAVVALSQQTVASFAAKYETTMEVTYRKLAAFLKKAGASRVYDIALARRIALNEHARDALHRIQEGRTPVLTSACPGFICYAEKKLGNEVLELISQTKSPQAVMGSIVKRLLPKKVIGATGQNRVWLSCIMPCHDKKLEAARTELSVNEQPEVDCVITTEELKMFMEKSHWRFTELPEADLDCDFGDMGAVGSCPSGQLIGSGGYLEHTLREAASQIVTVKPPEEFQYQTIGRGSDFKEYDLKNPAGKDLKFTAAYGFKNVQKIVRSIKMGKCKYDYVEVMSCPGGCNNGGGQLKSDENGRDLRERVETAYNTAESFLDPVQCEAIENVYALLRSGSELEEDKRALQTSYAARSADLLSTLQW